MMWTYLILFVLVFAFPLFFIKKRPNTNLEGGKCYLCEAQESDIFNSKATTCIKGSLCLYVMLHNIGLDLNNWPWFMYRIVETSGGIATGVFFFLSAFGIVRAYQKKGNKFLIKLLIVNVIKIYVISVLINIAIWLCFFRNTYETKDLVLRLLNLDWFNNFNRMNRHGWFITSIIGLYLIFALVFFIASLFKKYCKKYQSTWFVVACIIMILIPIILRILSQVFNKGGMYTREIDCFSEGIAYAMLFRYYNKYANKAFWPLLACLQIPFWLGVCFLEGIAAHALCLTLIVFSQRYTYYNKINEFLGKSCLGTYLWLYFSTCLMQPFKDNMWWWALTNIAFTMLLSVLTYGILFGINKLEKIVINKIENKRLKS